MSTYYLLHIPTGSVIELLCNTLDGATEIVLTADFYVVNNQQIQYTFYKKQIAHYLNKKRNYLTEESKQVELELLIKE